MSSSGHVLPEAGAEAWDRVKIVEGVLELLTIGGTAALVEGRISDVDVALGVQGRVAFKVNDTAGADAHVVLNILGVARVLVSVVCKKEVVGLASHTEGRLISV